MSAEKNLNVGATPVNVLRELSGLDFLRKLISGELPRAPISATLGFNLVEAEKGLVVFCGTPSFEHYNPLGGVHGGYTATLLDSCMACAVHTTLDAGFAYTTVEIKINYVRAINDKSGLLRAEGKVIHAGRQIATAEGRLVDANGKLYAHGTTTCMIFKLPEN
jgi:uncharacterized protein (TIGR00369 family)